MRAMPTKLVLWLMDRNGAAAGDNETSEVAIGLTSLPEFSGQTVLSLFIRHLSRKIYSKDLAAYNLWRVDEEAGRPTPPTPTSILFSMT
jgi:hypothetical protein